MSISPAPSPQFSFKRKKQSEGFSAKASVSLKVWLYWVLFVVLGVIDIVWAAPHWTAFNIYLTIIWSAQFPLTVLGLIGAHKARKMKLSSYAGTVDNLTIFQVPTIGRHDTLPALQRVVDSVLLHAPRNFTHWRVDIVTEAEASALEELLARYANHPNVAILVVPTEYQTVHGTRYKARANQYALDFRVNRGEDTKDVFVYHLDDDTAIGQDTVSAIAEFIATKSDEYYLAQGILAFPHELSNSWICRLADAIRPADDVTRFNFFTGLLGRPLAGLHGENLLVRSDIETEIGWDFGPDVTVEDAYFGLHFAKRYPKRSTFLPARTYGASPANIGSLIRQRRRWASGIFNLCRDSRISFRSKAVMSYSAAYWAFGMLQQVFLILTVAIIFKYTTSPVWAPFAVIWAFNFSFQIWMYWQGLKVNCDVSNIRTTYRRLAIAITPLYFVISVIEAIATVEGVWHSLIGRRGFDVISKPM